jgi:hypothetical protein
MKKLQDIPKKDLFSAPDGYFDTLPGKVMARIDKKKEAQFSPVFRYTLQYAVPAIVLIVAGFFWFRYDSSPESLLASIETEELVSYLADAENSLDAEFIDDLNFSEAEAAAVEEEVFGLPWADQLPDDVLNEIDINSL